MHLDIVHPTDPAEAITWLESSPLPFDSPTHRRYRGRDHRDRVFGSGRRRCDWVWAARRDGEVVAALAALKFGDGAVLDHLGDGPPEALDALVAAATADLGSLPESEAGLFLPPGSSARAEGAAWTDRLEASGWRLLVERHHYEFAPSPDLGTGTDLDLDLRPATTASEVAPLFAEVMRDTLDVHDRTLIDEVGQDKATRRALTMLVEEDPVESIRLASLPGDPTPVAMVSWTFYEGTGYLNFVGVGAAARGRGYARQLVAAATRALIEEGAHTLVADTDHANTPMATAFAASGWPVTEVRADFVRA